MKVYDLQPGDLVEMAGRSAVFIAETAHPIFLGLRLVIWKLDDGSWSHDALDSGQEVGTPHPARGYDDLMPRLRAALLGSP